MLCAWVVLLKMKPSLAYQALGLLLQLQTHTHAHVQALLVLAVVCEDDGDDDKFPARVQDRTHALVRQQWLWL